MPTYEYVCKGCGIHVETDKLKTAHPRHIVKKKVCGTLIRNWKSINYKHVEGGRG